LTTSSERSSANRWSEATAPADWVSGACLVANALSGVTFRVPATREAVASAVAGIEAHDWKNRLSGVWPRFIEPTDGETGSADGGSGAREIGLVATVPRTAGAWWDGYAGALCAVARALPRVEASPSATAVALIGLPLDRLEADRLADRDEVVRMVQQGLGLEAVSVWPSGSGLDELRRVAQARWLLAFPDGAEAARILAERTGASVLPVELPIGFAGSARFLRAVAEATGRSAEAFIAQELARYAPRLEWVVPHALLHQRIAIALDPAFASGLAGWLREVGCSVVEQAPDLVIGPRAAVEVAARERIAFLEMGFPSPGVHALAATPRFGFRGAVALVESIANRLAQWSLVEHRLKRRRRA